MEIFRTQTYTAALKHAFNSIATRKINLDIRRVFVVPDKFTLEAERTLVRALGGAALDAEVATWSRMALKAGVSGGSIGKEGSVMLVRGIIDANKPRFTGMLAKSSGRISAQAVYATVSQLKASGIKPEELKEDSLPSAQYKLGDIKLVCEEYERKLKSLNLADSSDRLRLLVSAAEKSDYFASAHFFVLGFDTLPYFSRRLLAVIDSRALSLTVYTTAREGAPDFVCEELRASFPPKTLPYKEIGTRDVLLKNLFRLSKNTFKTDKIHIYNGGSPKALYKQTARIIRNEVRGGLRYRDIGIIAESSPDLLDALDAYGISYNADKKYILAEHPFALYLIKLLEAVLSRCERGRLFDIAKNPYFVADFNDVAQFENYCLKFNINYSAFNREFTLTLKDDPEGERETAERIRKQLLKVVKDIPADNMPAASRVEAVKKVLDGLPMPDSLGMPVGSYIDFNARAWDSIKKILDEIAALSDTCSLEDFTEVFKSGLASCAVSALPNMTDAVFIAGPDGYRLAEYKVLIVPNCADGVIPAVKKDCGIISDRDITALAAMAVRVEPRINELNSRSREAAVQALALGEELHFLYSETDSAGEELRPSPIINELRRIFPEIITETEGEGFGKLDADFDDADTAEFVSGYFGTAEEARKAVTLRYNRALRSGETKLSKAYESAYYASNAVIAKEPDFAPLDCARELFFLDNATSITSIEDYFKCPYMFFNERGLRLCERKDGSVKPSEVGSFLHAIAEAYCKEGDKFDFDRAFNYALEEYKSSIPSEAYLKKLRAEARELIAAIENGLIYSGYKVLSAEAGFGEGKEFPAYKIPYGGGELNLKGKIDRVDVMGDFVRIIDYKTGRISLNFSDIYYGRHIQLPAYLGVLRKAGYKAAGVYFLPVNNDFAPNGKKTPPYRMEGYTTDDEYAARAMDKTMEADKESRLVSISLDGDGKLVKDDNVLSAEEFDGLCRYTELLVQKAASEISGGNIAPSPAKDVCKYCEFFGQCPGEQERAAPTIKLDKLLLGDM